MASTGGILRCQADGAYNILFAAMERPVSMHIPAYLLWILLLLFANLAFADARHDFIAAEAALKLGDNAEFEQFAAGLRDYPLLPYLLFEALKRRLASADDEAVRGFLQTYADTPLAPRIRRAWLDRLARTDRWEAYATFYVPDDSTERRCHHLHALIRSGQGWQAFSQVDALWLTGGSQPEACDPVFEAWREAGQLDLELIWQRITLAMERGNSALARYLGRFLPLTDMFWLDLWLDVHQHPESILDEARFQTGHPQRTAILVHGVERLAKDFPQSAARAWDLLQRRSAVSAHLSEQANAAVGHGLLEDGDSRGLHYLGRIPAHMDNLDRQERRLRAALQLEAWPQINAWIEDMPEGERKSEHWLYWQARALVAQGQRDAAARIYRQAAEERSLWGFLAAERVAAPYQLAHEPTLADTERMACIAQSPAGRRIAELRALGRVLDVRREVHWLTQDMGREDLMAVAVLAKRWGLLDLAIFTLAKSGFWDDLELRFPIAHLDLVHDQARTTGLDESWIYAILRQESAFNPQAVSPAGALGLMQLMPSTAGDIARSLGEPIPSRWDLLDPGRNIRLGSAYLARMEQRFGDNPVLTAAAYNAGPGRVAQWLPTKRMEADLWAATIPFRETRNYVRRVLAYRLIYDHRLGHDIQPLSKLMRPVDGDAAPKAADGNTGPASGG